MFFIDRVTFDGQLKMRNLHPRSSSRSPSSHDGSTRFIPLRGSAIQYNICDRRSRSNLWFGSYNSPRVSRRGVPTDDYAISCVPTCAC